MTTSWLKDLNLKIRSNSVKTFKSYVDLNSAEGQGEPRPEPPLEAESKDEEEEPTPVLLPGEIVISEAENVLKFNTLSELNKGISGLLLCTNFKVSFLTAKKFPPDNINQRNKVLKQYDICLINIDAVYHVNNGKKKKLSITSASESPEIIEIHCKDFRIYTFSFKFAPLHQRSVINTILHHAFVPRINLLFAFDYADKSKEKDDHSLLFTHALDWEAELRRCRCPGWRVTLHNEKFRLCKSLPTSFVVPSLLEDNYLDKCAPHFTGHRVPTWSWGVSSGVSIIRMAALDPSISDSRQKDILVDVISRAGGVKVPVRVFNLDSLCPSYKELQHSFLKLKDLCMPSTTQEFWQSENNYLTNLEATKWLHYISSCLSTALEAANCILSNTTVIFQENEGRDLSAVVSCITQIMLDPLYRTFSGFEQLIQKEWVALGHPFTERLRLISGFESEESPVFLLFLDCIWQLTEQCPAIFEFSETYLTCIWDSCRVSLFDTFLFSCQRDRMEAIFTNNSNFQTRSVWKWSNQFEESDIKLFSNPLYILNNYTPSGCRIQKEKLGIKPMILVDEDNLLEIDPYIKSLKLWHQCYLRWIPLAQVRGGGRPVLFLMNLKVSAEIKAMEEELKWLASPNDQPRPPPPEKYDYQFLDITSVFPFAPIPPWDCSSDFCLPSTTYIQVNDGEVIEGGDE